MRKGGFYIHESCTDTMIEILKIQYFDMKRIKLKIGWWNIGTGYPVPMTITETIEVKRCDMNKWKELNLNDLDEDGKLKKSGAAPA